MGISDWSSDVCSSDLSQSRTKELTSIKASRCELFVFLILRTHLLHLRVNCHDGYHPRSRETGTADPHTVHVIEAEDCAGIVAGDRSPIKNQEDRKSTRLNSSH